MSPSRRAPENAAGRFWVNMDCVACSMCVDGAPDHFRIPDSAHSTIVYRQPETEAEVDRCRRVLADCPTEAIVDDGPA